MSIPPNAAALSQDDDEISIVTSATDARCGSIASAMDDESSSVDGKGVTDSASHSLNTATLITAAAASLVSTSPLPEPLSLSPTSSSSSSNSQRRRRHCHHEIHNVAVVVVSIKLTTSP
jgi:hypothetical protein